MDKTTEALKIFNQWLENPLQPPDKIYVVTITEHSITFQGSNLGFPPEWYDKLHRLPVRVDKSIYIVDDIYVE